MKKYFVGIIPLFVLIAGLAVIPAVPRGNSANPTPPPLPVTQQVTPTDTEQARIEAIALSYAQGMALQGSPTSVLAKKMSADDYKRLFAASGKGDLGTEEVWLVLFKGKVVVNNPAPVGTISQTVTDNMWVELNPVGGVLGWGSFPPGTNLDLKRS